MAAGGLVPVIIDGRRTEVPKGTRVMVAADSLGIRIPRFCYHPSLSVLGACRICLVQVFLPVRDRATGGIAVDEKTGEPVYREMPTLQTSCTLEVQPDMKVVTDSKEAVEGREAVIEFILANHPLDCPICDKGGECELQEMTMECGPSRQVFTEARILRDKARRIGAGIVLDQERCIVCFRCTRFLSEWASEQVFGFTERGDRDEIEPAFGEPIEKARFAGNTIDLCPVGALTSDFFRFSARPWELADTPGVCPHCPVGCNLELGGRLGTLCRVRPRGNYYVNDTWICDRGRYDYEWVNDGRLTKPTVRRGDEQRASDWDAALTRAASALHDTGSFAVVLSPSTSCEAGWLVSRLAGMPNCAGLYVEDDFDLAGPFSGSILDLMYSDVVLLASADVLENQPILWLRMHKRALEGRLRAITASHQVAARDQKRLSWSGADLPKGAEAPLLAGLADLIASGEAATPDGISPEWLRATAAALRDAKRPAVIVGAVPLEGYPAVRGALGRLASLLQEGRRSRVAHGVLTGGANSRGLRAVGCASVEAWTSSNGWRRRLGAGETGALLIVGGDPLAYCEAALAQAARGLSSLVYVGTNENETSALADVVLPAASFQEEESTFVSFEGRLQRSIPTNEPIWDTLPTCEILARLGELMGVAAVGRSVAQLRAEMARASESMKPWADPIPQEGVVVPG